MVHKKKLLKRNKLKAKTIKQEKIVYGKVDPSSGACMNLDYKYFVCLNFFL